MVIYYQNFRDHHEHEYDNAKADILLKVRSKGRVRAFAELMANLLRESEAYINGVEATAPQEQNFHDQPSRIGYLAYQYKVQMESVIDSQDPFGPVRTLLLDLVEELAALTELAKTNAEVQTLLLDAGHAINAAVQPCDLLGPESTAECIRSYQINHADLAFEKAVFAAAALFPTIVVEQNSAQH